MNESSRVVAVLYGAALCICVEGCSPRAKDYTFCEALLYSPPEKSAYSPVLTGASADNLLNARKLYIYSVPFNIISNKSGDHNSVQFANSFDLFVNDYALKHKYSVLELRGCDWGKFYFGADDAVVARQRHEQEARTHGVTRFEYATWSPPPPNSDPCLSMKGWLGAKICEVFQAL